MMKVGITGGRGFIGHHLVNELIGYGIQVVVLDNQHRALHELPYSKFLTSVVGDIRYPNDLKVFSGCECIINLAAESSVMRGEENPVYTYGTNVLGVENLTAFCLLNGIRLVQASSREVYGEVGKLPVHESMELRAKNVYGVSKAAAEGILLSARTIGLDVSILRFANVIGIGDRGRLLPLWLTAINRGLPLKVYGGRQILDFVPVRIVLDALVFSAFQGNVGPINVASGQGFRILDVAKRICMLRPTTKLEILSPREAEVVGFQADVRQMVQLGISPPEDPLAELPLLAAHYA